MTPQDQSLANPKKDGCKLYIWLIQLAHLFGSAIFKDGLQDTTIFDLEKAHVWESADIPQPAGSALVIFNLRQQPFDKNNRKIPNAPKQTLLDLSNRDLHDSMSSKLVPAHLHKFSISHRMMNAGMSESMPDKRLMSSCGTTVVSYLGAQSPPIAAHLVSICEKLKTTMGYKELCMNFDIATDIRPTAIEYVDRYDGMKLLIKLGQVYHLKHTLMNNNMFQPATLMDGSKVFAITEHHWPAFLRIIESLGMTTVKVEA